MKRLFKGEPAAISEGVFALKDFGLSEPIKGIPAVSCEAVLAHFHAPLEELRQALALDAAVYEAIVLPVVKRYAQKVHLLPASESHHHAGIGGLFQHSLEVAIKARRRADDFLYGREQPPQVRGDVESAWRLAISLAGLFHDNGKILTDYRVVDKTGKLVWNPNTEGLNEWAHRAGCERYFLIWNQRRIRKHEDAGTIYVTECLGSECIRYLTRHDEGPLLSLFQSLIGHNNDERFGELIRWADHTSVASDLKGHHFSPGASAGRRKDELLLEAIKSLLQDGVWNPDGDSPMVQQQENALLIDWVQAQPSLIRRLKEMSPIGWSENADDLADLLLERGHASTPDPTTESLGRYWLHTQGTRTVRVLKLTVAPLAAWVSPTEDLAASSDASEMPSSLSAPTCDEQSEAEYWLNQQPCARDIVKTLSLLHESIELTHLQKKHSQIWVPYPEAFKALGIPPIPSLKLFQDAGMLQLDDKTGLRAVLELEGERGFLFTQVASGHISAIWPLKPTERCEVEPTAPKSQTILPSVPERLQGALTDPERVFSPERLRAIALVPNERR